MYEINKAEADASRYKISIHESGKQSADVFAMSAEEHQKFVEAFAAQDWFQIEVDARYCMYNIPMLSSIKIEKMAEVE